MARSKTYDEPRVATAVRIPESLHADLLDLADQNDVSVNLLVTKAISAYLYAGKRKAREERLKK
jgi:predicted HicB family RNase H-like nuclease